MHFRDSKRKVDYVLVYHYRKHSSDNGGESQGPVHRPGSLAIISNGETAKSQQKQQEGSTPEAQVIDVAPQDALEVAKEEQREEFERNLLEAGLELEKEVEVRETQQRGSGCLLIDNFFAAVCTVKVTYAHNCPAVAI
ncbi:PREDICTED: anoctamin-2-like [Thamnophis sirtalis]|uniref:Anoctamin-2-like n=1 Tax=Thamnophis sirtalis TaxID=35019 RepID=A0A6I9YST4_9SAUR|nr:PREDICTED: anoctamin-2-like [Thamnophis sirtalis]